MHFGCWRRRLFTSGGSAAITSSAAPAITPRSSASASASSSTTPPREVFTRSAFGFISARRSALISFAVSGTSGQCTLT